MAELIELVGKRFDLVSYLFFIKDWEQFMPIVPTYFEKAFKLLRVESDGVPLRLSMNCSWETYRACNDALMQIQQYLMDLDVPRVRLIDAHTFCWIISRLEPENPSEKAVTDATAAVELNSPPSVQLELSKEHDDPVEVDWEAVTKMRAFLGRLGEEHALNFERTRLVTLGKNELAEKVAIVSSDHRLGYDIRSFESDGTLRYIEVKVVRVNETDTSFFLTSNELEQSRQHENYWLYLVSHVRSSNSVIRTMHSKEMNKEWLSPIIYKVAMPLPDRMLEHSGGNN